MYDYCKTLLLLYVLTTLVQLPEDGNCAETCRSKLMAKYITYIIVHLLVLVKFVNQFIMHGIYTVKPKKLSHKRQIVNGLSLATGGYLH
jgi:hypothetical protein